MIGFIFIVLLANSTSKSKPTDKTTFLLKKCRKQHSNTTYFCVCLWNISEVEKFKCFLDLNHILNVNKLRGNILATLHCYQLFVNMIYKHNSNK